MLLNVGLSSNTYAKRPPHNLKRFLSLPYTGICRPLPEVCTAANRQIPKYDPNCPCVSKNRIQPVDPGPQSLRPEIRRRINHHIVARRAKAAAKGRKPLIMRIPRIRTTRAMTPQSRARPIDVPRPPTTVTPHPLARHVPHCNQPASNLAFVGTLCTLWHLCVLCVNSSFLSFPKKQKIPKPPPSSTWDPTQKLVILKLSDPIRSGFGDFRSFFTRR